MKTPIRIILYANSAILVLLGLLALVYPTTRALLDLRDPALRQAGVPRKAWRLAASLTPRYAAWARARGAAGPPVNAATNLAGADSPLEGAVCYLLALDNLQTAWDAGDHSGGAEPKVFAKEAIQAVTDLFTSPTETAVAKQSRGDALLTRDNVRYRTLLIAALGCREQLLKDGVHLALLHEQVETLAREIEASPRGMINDHPGECFPADTLLAVAVLQRVGESFGLITNRSEFVTRAARAFIGGQATRQGLVPYRANAKDGRHSSEARGLEVALVCLGAPELWPTHAKQWFQACEKSFWQERFAAAGLREFEKTVTTADWGVDPDSGPVLGGFGLAANTFGLGAARRNGRFDRAFPLAAEVVAGAWELPGGLLAVPRLFASPADAPLLGESAVLWMLSTQPAKGLTSLPAGAVPSLAYGLTILGLVLGLFLVFESVWTVRVARREPEREYPAPVLQVIIWGALVAGGLASLFTSNQLLGVVCLLLLLVFPRAKKHPRDRGNKPEDLPPGYSQTEGPAGTPPPAPGTAP